MKAKRVLLFLLVCALALLVLSGTALAEDGSQSTNAIVSAQWLEDHLGASDLVVVDVRSADAYEAAHIPGSVSIPFAMPNCAWLKPFTGPPSYPDNLLMELPYDASDDEVKDAFFTLLGKNGITPDSMVVVVGPAPGPPTIPAKGLAGDARVATTLVWAGVKKVAILDGGLPQWSVEGRLTTTDVTNLDEVTYSATVLSGVVVDTDYVKNHIGRATIIDARDLDVYLGTTLDPDVPELGHIQTARSLPAPWIWRADGTYRSAAELRAMAALVVGTLEWKEVIVYCSVGGYASSWWYVLTQVLGYQNVKFYDGSAQGWFLAGNHFVHTGSASAAFPDVPGTHPYSTAIDGIAAADAISGFEDGTFGPDKLVIRQQFAKMIVETMGLTVTGSEVCPFGDVAAQVGSDPFYPSRYVAVCAQNNITQGRTATTFAPHENISRQQVMTMVVRAADALASDTLDPVPTGWSGVLSYGDPDHGANIKKAEYNGLLAGIQGPGGTLASWDMLGYATRGEVAQILWNLWHKVPERPFKGFLVGQIEVNWYGTPFNPPQPPTMDGMTTGYFTDLRLTQMENTHILPQDPNAGWEGTGTLTADNGDELFFSYGDHLTGWEFTTPAGYVFVSHDGWFEITGGTGRFAGATGSGVTTAYHVYPGPGDPSDPVYPRYALTAPWDVTWIYEGTINY